ncbi:hypothetical protein Emed_000465 [Eimeria media]
MTQSLSSPSTPLSPLSLASSALSREANEPSSLLVEKSAVSLSPFLNEVRRRRKARKHKALACILSVVAAISLLALCFRAHRMRFTAPNTGRALAGGSTDEDDDEAERAFILESCLDLEAEYNGAQQTPPPAARALPQVVPSITQQSQAFTPGFPSTSSMHPPAGPHTQVSHLLPSSSAQPSVAVPGWPVVPHPPPPQIAGPPLQVWRPPFPYVPPPFGASTASSTTASPSFGHVVSTLPQQQVQQLPQAPQARPQSPGFVASFPSLAELGVQEFAPPQQYPSGLLPDAAGPFPLMPQWSAFGDGEEPGPSWMSWGLRGFYGDGAATSIFKWLSAGEQTWKNGGGKQLPRKYRSVARSAWRETFVLSQPPSKPPQQASAQGLLPPSTGQQESLEQPTSGGPPAPSVPLSTGPPAPGPHAAAASSDETEAAASFIEIEMESGPPVRIQHPPPPMPANAHPYYRLPPAPEVPGSVYIRETGLFHGRGRRSVLHSLVILRRLLAQPQLTPFDAEGLVFEAACLIKYLYQRHKHPADGRVANQACYVLGMRFLCFDILVSLTQMLGPAMNPQAWFPQLVATVPTDFDPKAFEDDTRITHYSWLAVQLTEALELLKQGRRPTMETVVMLKRALFHQASAPLRFRNPNIHPSKQWKEIRASHQGTEKGIRLIDPSTHTTFELCKLTGLTQRQKATFRGWPLSLVRIMMSHADDSSNTNGAIRRAIKASCAKVIRNHLRVVLRRCNLMRKKRQEEVKADQQFLSAASRPHAVSPRSRSKRKLGTNAALATLVTVMAFVGLLVVCYRADSPRLTRGASGRSLAAQSQDDSDESDLEESFILEACLNLQSEIDYRAPGETTGHGESEEKAVANIFASIQKEAQQFKQTLPEPYLPPMPTSEASQELLNPYTTDVPWGVWTDQGASSSTEFEALQPSAFWGAGPSTQGEPTFMQLLEGSPVDDPQGVFVGGVHEPEWGHPSVVYEPLTSVSAAGEWPASSSGSGADEAQQMSSTFAFQQIIPETHVTPQTSYSQEVPHLLPSQAQTLQAGPSVSAVHQSEGETSSLQQESLSSSTSDSSAQASASKPSEEESPPPPRLRKEGQRAEKRKQSEAESSAVTRREKRARVHVFSSDEEEQEEEGGDTVSPRSPSSPQLPPSLRKFDFDDVRSFFSTPGQMKIEPGFMVITGPLGTVYRIPHPPERTRLGTHPLYCLPRLLPGALTRGFNLSAILKPPYKAKAPLRCLRRVHELLNKKTLVPNQAQVLVFMAEGLVSYLMFRHRSTLLALHYSQMVDKLGTRYMCLDAIVSMLQLLGPAMTPHEWWDSFVRWVPTEYHPRELVTNLPQAAEHRDLSIRLSNALKILKQGQRPPEEETVKLKRDLLRTHATAQFRDKRWDLWRQADEDFQKANE